MKKLLLLVGLLTVFNCTKQEASPEFPDVQFPDDTVDLNDIVTPTVEPSSTILCENGFADIYPCSNYDLLSFIPLEVLGADFINDSWGWTDQETGKDYLLQGLDNGVAFLDITNPNEVNYVGKLETPVLSSIWRDIKVHQNHAYVVSEANGHGLQVFDLTQLRALSEFKIFTSKPKIESFGSAHNIAINQASGYAYILGARSLYNGAPVFVNLSDPANPVEQGGFAAARYTHDAQIVNYHGPDTDYQDRELLFASSTDGGENNRVVIADVSDKKAPELIVELEYFSSGYAHQGWLDETHRFFFLGDELDERHYGNNTRIIVFDLQDINNPVLHHTFLGNTSAIDHNLYIKDTTLYLANYSAGFREIDISGIEDGQMEEVGFFDSFPDHNSNLFNGVWNVYPFFESGVIAISDSDYGVFLVQKSTP